MRRREAAVEAASRGERTAKKKELGVRVAQCHSVLSETTHTRGRPCLFLLYGHAFITTGLAKSLQKTRDTRYVEPDHLVQLEAVGEPGILVAMTNAMVLTMSARMAVVHWPRNMSLARPTCAPTINVRM